MALIVALPQINGHHLDDPIVALVEVVDGLFLSSMAPLPPLGLERGTRFVALHLDGGVIATRVAALRIIGTRAMTASGAGSGRGVVAVATGFAYKSE